jgi:hypothetical protein
LRLLFLLGTSGLITRFGAWRLLRPRLCGVVRPASIGTLARLLLVRRGSTLLLPLLAIRAVAPALLLMVGRLAARLRALVLLLGAMTALLLLTAGGTLSALVLLFPGI